MFKIDSLNQADNDFLCFVQISDEDDVEEEFTSLIQISSLSQHTISDPDVIHRVSHMILESHRTFFFSQ